MTDTNGESEVLELPVGKFFIKEIEAPKGFLKDETIYLMEISTGQTTELVLKDEPTKVIFVISVKLRKHQTISERKILLN